MSTLNITNLRGEVIHTVRASTLRGSDLRTLDLSYADLAGVDLRGANLADTNLCGADFFQAQLQEVDLSGAFVVGTHFAGTAVIDGGCTESGVRVVAVPHGADYRVFAHGRGRSLAEARREWADDPDSRARLDLIETVIKSRVRSDG